MVNHPVPLFLRMKRLFLPALLLFAGFSAAQQPPASPHPASRFLPGRKVISTCIISIPAAAMRFLCSARWHHHLFDAGEAGSVQPRTTSRNTPIRPNDTKKPYEWIAHYIQQVAPESNMSVIDYAVISHFHDDHFGGWYPGAPLSAG